MVLPVSTRFLQVLECCIGSYKYAVFRRFPGVVGVKRVLHGLRGGGGYGGARVLQGTTRVLAGTIRILPEMSSFPLAPHPAK